MTIAAKTCLWEHYEKPISITVTFVIEDIVNRFVISHVDARGEL